MLRGRYAAQGRRSTPVHRACPPRYDRCISASFTNPRLNSIFESPSLPGFDLPADIEEIYGRFGLDADVVYANFVSSLDGAVAFQGVPRSSAIISGGSVADRFMVALLRASADAIIVGAGTYRAHTGPWTPANAFPAVEGAFGELRRMLAMRTDPTLVVVTRSGNLGPAKRVPQELIVVSMEPDEAHQPDAPEGSHVIDLSGSASIVPDLVVELRRRGFSRLLTEGGPQLMGEFLRASAVDELFLTVSPLVFGSTQGEIVGIADEATFERGEPIRTTLSSVRTDGSHLFLRYAIEHPS